MTLDRTELSDVLFSNHPARPYFVAAAAISGFGIARGGWRGVAMLAVGGLAFLCGVDEVQRIRRLHGGNYHGVNGPPKMEEVVSML